MIKFLEENWFVLVLLAIAYELSVHGTAIAKGKK